MKEEGEIAVGVGMEWGVGVGGDRPEVKNWMRLFQFFVSKCKAYARSC